MAYDLPAPSPKMVAVFGASWATRDSALYALSVQLGSLLAASGFSVVSGGYGGCMEAVSAGAASSADARVVGVLVPSLFPDRVSSGNEFLRERVNAPTLLSRIDTMLCMAPEYIIALPGTLGTLTELLCAWNNAALCSLRGVRPPVIIAWRTPWEALLTNTARMLNFPEEQIKLVVFVDGCDDAIKALSPSAASA
jgi:uncharacterized protein (TIGR00725 family)